MLVVNRPAFITGLILGASFLCVLALIFMPLFGDGRNGLEYADDLFNRLSKGSSYFIPKVARNSAAQSGETFAFEFRLADETEADGIAALLRGSGSVAERTPAGFRLSGDLGGLLAAALRDADDGYRNDAEALQARHGMPAQSVLAAWWRVLRQLDQALQREKRLAAAKAVHEVMKKALEPAHNYFGIEAERVGSMAIEMIGLLAFYVVYTLWWGMAIFYLFEGVGLAMQRQAPAKPAGGEPAVRR